MMTIIEVAIGVALAPVVFILGLAVLRSVADGIHAVQDACFDHPGLIPNAGILACVGALAGVMWWVG